MSELNASEISDDRARQVFESYRVQRAIVRGCFERISEADFDFRLVDTPERRSDSPREGLADVIATQRNFLDAMERGRIEPGEVGDDLKSLDRSALLAELTATDVRLHALLAAPDFDSHGPVAAPWGTIHAIDMVTALRDHEILHVGWNLALMDALGIERFDALSGYWG